MSSEANAPAYLIWSNEHGMWWKPGERGYTTLTHQAGRYSEADVERILAKANEAAEPGRPNELACLVPWTSFGREEFDEASPVRSNFPSELTPELSDVLGLPNFQTTPMAHAFRDAGVADIRRRLEDEQAYVLHWLVTLVLEHGADWRKHAGERLGQVIKAAKVARALDGEKAASDEQ